MARISPRSLSNRTWLAAAALLLAFSAGFVALEYSGAEPPASAPISVPVRFTDIRAAAGITFRHDNTFTAEKNYIETMGNGLGWIDYNQDGLMDLYLVQTAETEWYKPPRPLRSALYRNNGDGTFTDVTEKAGVGGRGPLRAGRGGGRLSTTTAFPTSMSPATAMPSFTTITAMVLSRM